MGWDYRHGATKADVVKEYTGTRDGHYETDDYHRTTLASRLVGKTLWVVWEYGPTIGPKQRALICVLLDASPGYGWGSKSFGEEAGPYDYTCPVAFFDLVPTPPNDWAANWRAQVRITQAAAVARKARVKALRLGSYITLTARYTHRGPYRVVQTSPKLLGVDLLTHVLYRLPKAGVDTVEPPPTEPRPSV